MALGNLADLEELEPTPGRPDPLTLYHKVGTQGRPNSGWGLLLSGGWGWVGEDRRALCKLGGITHPVPTLCLPCPYSVQSGLSAVCPGSPSLGVESLVCLLSPAFLWPLIVLPGIVTKGKCGVCVCGVVGALEGGIVAWWGLCLGSFDTCVGVCDETWERDVP